MIVFNSLMHRQNMWCNYWRNHILGSSVIKLTNRTQIDGLFVQRNATYEENHLLNPKEGLLHTNNQLQSRKHWSQWGRQKVDIMLPTPFLFHTIAPNLNEESFALRREFTMKETFFWILSNFIVEFNAIVTWNIHHFQRI